MPSSKVVVPPLSLLRGNLECLARFQDVVEGTVGSG